MRMKVNAEPFTTCKKCIHRKHVAIATDDCTLVDREITEKPIPEWCPLPDASEDFTAMEKLQLEDGDLVVWQRKGFDLPEDYLEMRRWLNDRGLPNVLVVILKPGEDLWKADQHDLLRQVFRNKVGHNLRELTEVKK